MGEKVFAFVAETVSVTTALDRGQVVVALEAQSKGRRFYVVIGRLEDARELLLLLASQVDELRVREGQRGNVQH